MQLFFDKTQFKKMLQNFDKQYELPGTAVNDDIVKALQKKNVSFTPLQICDLTNWNPSVQKRDIQCATTTNK